jgi:hypothetical protein
MACGWNQGARPQIIHYSTMIGPGASHANPRTEAFRECSISQ